MQRQGFVSRALGETFGGFRHLGDFRTHRIADPYAFWQRFRETANDTRRKLCQHPVGQAGNRVLFVHDQRAAEQHGHHSAREADVAAHAQHDIRLDAANLAQAPARSPRAMPAGAATCATGPCRAAHRSASRPFRSHATEPVWPPCRPDCPSRQHSSRGSSADRRRPDQGTRGHRYRRPSRAKFVRVRVRSEETLGSAPLPLLTLTPDSSLNHS